VNKRKEYRDMRGFSRLTAIFLCFFVLACFAAFSDSTAHVKKQLKIVWIHDYAVSQSETRAEAGFRDWLKESGQPWDLTALDTKGNSEEITNDLENAVKNKADAVIVSMMNLAPIAQVISKAASEGATIFSIDSGWIPGVVQDITTNNYAMSADVSLYFLESLGGKGNIIFLRYPDHHGTRKRGEVMKAMLQEYPNIKVLAEYNIPTGGKFFEDTTRVMEDFVTRFGNSINGVWAPWDEPALASSRVLEAHHIKAIVTGIDGHPDAIKEIKRVESPYLATVRQPFEDEGRQTGMWIEEMKCDGKDPSTMFTLKTTYINAPLIHK
jgi:ribose transport system substrate-binding protein